MNQTFVLSDVFKRMSCFSVVEVDFPSRCYLSKSIEQCDHIMNWLNYYKMMYCTLSINSTLQESAFMLVLIIFVFYVCMWIEHLAGKYFSPILKITSQKLGMNQYLSGVALLCMSNCLPELLANFLPIRHHAPLFTMVISNAVCVILMSGGMVCYLRPFKINGYCAVRDLLFLMFSCELLGYFIETDRALKKPECAGLVIVYLIFLAVTIVDLHLMLRRIKKLKREISHLKNEPFSPPQHNLLNQKRQELFELEEDNKLVIHTESADSRTSSNRKSIRFPARKGAHSHMAINMYGFTKKKLQRYEPTGVDVTMTRTCLHDPDNPKNLFLWSEALESLMPIDLQAWRQNGFFRRIFLIVNTPVVLFCTFFIPNVDCTLDKHGWSKLLNCIQIVTNPFMTIIMIHATVACEHFKHNYYYAAWSCVLTVPLAIAAFCVSRTDLPPAWHEFLIILTASSSLALLTICLTELEVLCCVIGSVWHLTEDFVNTSIRAFAAGIGDLIFNVEMALSGYERMAFASILATPIFSITFGLGFPLYFLEGFQEEGGSDAMVRDYGENTHIFFLLTIVTFLVWAFTFNFYTRRSAGIFAFYLYFLFTLYAVLIECNVIHPFSSDFFNDPV